MYPPLLFTSKEKVPVGKTADDELRAYQAKACYINLHSNVNLISYAIIARCTLRQEEDAMSSQGETYNLSMTISQVNFGYRLSLT